MSHSVVPKTTKNKNAKSLLPIDESNMDLSLEVNSVKNARKNLKESPSILTSMNQLIVYRGNKLRRRTIQDMKYTLLDKCDQIIESTVWPFMETSLNTDKVFADLVAFYKDGNFSRRPSASLDPMSFDNSNQNEESFLRLPHIRSNNKRNNDY